MDEFFGIVRLWRDGKVQPREVGGP
jgi:hypothetical protein